MIKETFRTAGHHSHHPAGTIGTFDSQITSTELQILQNEQQITQLSIQQEDELPDIPFSHVGHSPVIGRYDEISELPFLD